jgi:DNA mismatch repair protein MutS
LTDIPFVPNDTYLDLDDNRIAIITGPNMAGKSTYMRQIALMVLMAQAGSFVPAEYAHIGMADRIFTRVGASDDLASGQSTFMVEMSEVANILLNATARSLLILDEIGRGTSTYDGLSIAWSVIEYVNDKARLGARTLFATHYHELTELEERLHGIKNYCVSVRKKGEDIIFLRKINRGGADKSYGVEVARLAGVPEPVIERASNHLQELDEADINQNGRKRNLKPVEGQLDLFASNSLTKAEHEVLDEIRGLDASLLTPLDALNKLYYLQKKLK